jgi:anti-sigma factor RsiW
MSGCNHDDLLGLARGELTAERASQVEAHAERCPACAGELRWLRTERALFRQEPGGPSSHVWQGIERRIVIAREERRARRQRWLQVGGGGAIMAAAAALLLVVWFGGAPPVSSGADAQASAATLAPPAEEPEQATEASLSLDAAEEEVKAAILRLERVYARERDRLEPEVVLRLDEELEGLKHVLALETDSARDDVRARRRVLRAYASYMRTMQGLVLEVRK